MEHLDTRLSVHERVSALLARMTTEEKAHQLTGIMAFDLVRSDGSDLSTTEHTLTRVYFSRSSSGKAGAWK
ncbi:hypothetical protein [Microbacterium sp. Leaf159]|uniref:hypothetical protein n=1 Tax=Microbacterium sp. Leaf159 TaxID=1736279 RepID=UPI00070236E6|nr:hypothetical protein [Microbacterium sp. Leaf159]KQR39335.1 hypothetical protein ASF80_07925 [Microbacterium sp. Leaf159]